VSPFEDYETFMIRNGRVNPHTKDEIEFGAPLMQALN